MRSKYKRPSGVDPTILVNVQETEPPETDDAGERRVVSFTAALARYLDRPRSSAASSAASAPPALSRDTYLLLPGDLMFVEAGDERLPDGSIRSTLERWWAMQASAKFERERMRPSCQVNAF